MFEINTVHLKSDLLSYVTMAGGRIEQDNPHRYSCACPLHGGDNTTAFSIYFEKGKWKWHCYTGNCGGGDAIEFVRKWQGLGFREACEWILGERITDLESLKVSAEKRLEEARLEEIAATQRKEARLRELQETERHLVYCKQRAESQWAQEMWTQAGLDEGLQDFFYLGANEDFRYWEKKIEYHSPTLTIPYFDEHMNPIFINHRLVNPINPKSKYRPDVSGIDVPDFLSIPTMGYDGDLVIVVEGAKKAMVTWSKAPTETQVIGVSTQGAYKQLEEKLKGKVGKKVIVIPDPDKPTEKNEKVLTQSRDLARAVGGKILRIPEKVDDFIVRAGISSDSFYKLLKQARHV